MRVAVAWVWARRGGAGARALGRVLLGFALPWLAFVRLAREVCEDGRLPGDRGIPAFLHAHGGPGQQALALGLSYLGGPVGGVATALLVGLGLGLGLGAARRWRAVAFFGLAVGGSAALNLAAKWLLARPRPAPGATLGAAAWAAAAETSFSFPSGHSMAAAALAASLVVLAWPTRGRWLAVAAGAAWALGMGWARLYLGLHYPSDVLAGWVGAVGWVGGLRLLGGRWLGPTAATTAATTDDGR